MLHQTSNLCSCVDTSHPLAPFIACTMENAQKNCSSLSHPPLSYRGTRELTSAITVTQYVVFHHVLKDALPLSSSSHIRQMELSLLLSNHLVGRQGVGSQSCDCVTIALGYELESSAYQVLQNKSQITPNLQHQKMRFIDIYLMHLFSKTIRLVVENVVTPSYNSNMMN